MHTTGTDIQHVMNANAVLTLGKDMTLRDYAQGAFRMRGIGKGQRIFLYVIPEVDELVKREVSRASLSNKQQLTDIAAVMAWLVINSMKSERLQFNLLQMQNATNIWRKNAFRKLLDSPQLLTTVESDPSGLLKRALDVFQEEVQYTLPDIVPVDRDVVAAIKQRSQACEVFLETDQDRKLLAQLLDNVNNVTELDMATRSFGEEVRGWFLFKTEI